MFPLVKKNMKCGTGAFINQRICTYVHREQTVEDTISASFHKLIAKPRYTTATTTQD